MSDRFVVVNPFDGHEIGALLDEVAPEHRHHVNRLPPEHTDSAEERES